MRCNTREPTGRVHVYKSYEYGGQLPARLGKVVREVSRVFRVLIKNDAANEIRIEAYGFLHGRTMR